MICGRKHPNAVVSRRDWNTGRLKYDAIRCTLDYDHDGDHFNSYANRSWDIVIIENQSEANRINKTGETGPHRAANGHLMWYAVTFPKDEKGRARDYRVGDTVRYSQWDAWCDIDCDHSEIGPLPDY